jgi:hypothetical protein
MKPKNRQKINAKNQSSPSKFTALILQIVDTDSHQNQLVVDVIEPLLDLLARSLASA